MARMTDAYIAGLKPKAVGYELSDPQQRGLRVAVYPSGRRTFIVRYRFDGRSKKLTLLRPARLPLMRYFRSPRVTTQPRRKASGVVLKKL